MDTHPIESLMRSTMENIRNMIDVNTIIGDVVESKDGSVIIPISRVSFGFASGGSEFNSKDDVEKNQDYPFGGGGGAGVSVKPVAFLVIKNDSIKVLSVDHENTFDRVVDNIPQWIEMLKGMGKDKGAKGSSCNTKKDNDSFTTTDTF